MKNSKILRMASMALLIAMVLVLQMISGMIPPVGGFSISLVLIPIVLGAAAYGPGAGALLGGAFGAIVFVNCVTGADVGGQMVFQASPILCFLVVMGKGILSGFAAGLVYQAFKGKDSYLAMGFAAIVCPVVNTGVFIVSMLTLFKDVLAVWAGGGEVIAYVLSGLVLANFLPELLINIIFSPAGQRILQAVKK